MEPCNLFYNILNTIKFMVYLFLCYEMKIENTNVEEQFETQ